MKQRFALPALVAVGLAVLFAAPGPRAQDPGAPFTPGQPPPPPPGQLPVAEDGVVPLTRGPVHEAFAQPLTARPGPNPVIPVQPPNPIEEMPPDQRPAGDHVVWIPGYWAFDEDQHDYLWVSGFWRDVPPGRVWQAGYWQQVEGGWQWISGYWADAQLTNISYLPPPPPSIDAGPSVAAPNDNSIYVPGCWIYQQTRYVWRPGTWAPAYADWSFVPAHYAWAPAGCVFIEGYWDYSLPRRGLLFCPVRFTQPLWQRPNWFYRPSYVVDEPALATALFVNPGYHRYDFGDYYGPQYARRGIVPWFNYQVTRNVPEPLFAHDRWRHRDDRGWAQGLATLDRARRDGQAPLPPRTVFAQRQLIQNINTTKQYRVGDRVVRVNDPRQVTRHLAVAGPLGEARRQGGVKLQAVPRQSMPEVRRMATHLQETSVKRREVETRMVPKGQPGGRPLERPLRAKVELPRMAPPAMEARTFRPPTHPQFPKTVERPHPKAEPIRPIRVEPRPK